VEKSLRTDLKKKERGDSSRKVWRSPKKEDPPKGRSSNASTLKKGPRTGRKGEGKGGNQKSNTLHTTSLPPKQGGYQVGKLKRMPEKIGRKETQVRVKEGPSKGGDGGSQDEIKRGKQRKGALGGGRRMVCGR